MNGYQKCIAALRGEYHEEIPVMLHNFMSASCELGISMGEFRESPRRIADVFIHSAEKYGLDGVFVDMDTVTLAGSVGVKVDFPRDHPARCHTGMLESLSGVKKLSPVKIGNYKYVQIWLEAVRLLKEYFVDELLIRGNCDQAPFSLASMVRGPEPWLIDLFISEPALVTDLLEYCTDATCQFIRLMSETGAHMVSNGDSTAGPEMISPDLYEQYALPYEKKVVETAHECGLFYTLHICGNTELILGKMIETGADALEIDHKTDIKKAFDIMNKTTVFSGNIDPSGVLAMGTPEMVCEKTLELLNVFSKTNRFILNSGCTLPASTPEKNIRAFVETARNFSPGK